MSWAMLMLNMTFPITHAQETYLTIGNCKGCLKKHDTVFYMENASD